jgi:hypothetical protein
LQWIIQNQFLWWKVKEDHSEYWVLNKIRGLPLYKSWWG